MLRLAARWRRRLSSMHAMLAALVAVTLLPMLALSLVGHKQQHPVA